MYDPEKEVELIKKYQSGDTAVLPELMNVFRPIAKIWERNTASTNLPRSAVNAEIKTHLIDAIKTFDAERGVKPSTWINSRMPKVYRFIYEHQNIGRLPENINIQVGTFKNSQVNLLDKLGREPTAAELADDLGWHIGEVERVGKMIRKDLALSSDYDFNLVEPNKSADLIHFAYYEMEPQEKLVFEHLMGIGGKPKLKSKEIAEKLHLSPSTISNIKKKIAERLEKFA